MTAFLNKPAPDAYKGCRIRNLVGEDLPEILPIEQRCFADPWPEEWFTTLFKTDNLLWAGIKNGIIIGYLVALFSGQVCYLANIVIDEPYRGQGFGRWLLRKLRDYTIDSNGHFIMLEVRKSNQNAISLYRSEGYKFRGIKPGYYNGREDALVFLLEL